MRTAIDLEFVPRSSVIRTARDAATVLHELLPSDRVDDVRLLVSEIVTNSVRHRQVPRGREDWIRLRVVKGEGAVRVEVSNAGSSVSFERAAKEGALRESGWGMYLLEHLADRWGVDSSPDDTCVWFEIDAA